MANAFAFKNFDKDRILARNFFDSYKALKFRNVQENEPSDFLRISDKNLTDDEVLKNYSKGETIPHKEFNYQALRYIYSVISLYYTRVEKHSFQLIEVYKEIMVIVGNTALNSTDNNFHTSPESDFQALKSKVKRLEKINEKYLEILRQILNLKEKFLKCIEELKSDIESAYIKNFSQNLKLARKATGYKQEDFARLLGLARTDIAQFESGRKTPSFVSLCRIVNSPFVSPNILKIQ